ncbi:hypothetical protein GCM10025865_06930 [Paraoerskovia sediminicola]|uniref:DUF559 domain-containing protein n=1 Tax=Paraoerskovia sediminicola TaxID=1138587 RepID=A0ABN6X9K5_9CELL|nr:DUF559 domain-containing protein [Paraoerskovia sediminicola]BDZ41394.1 hypothetical protein GCM10025865_06930 [Paraoerskovia sediminicola]
MATDQTRTADVPATKGLRRAGPVARTLSTRAPFTRAAGLEHVTPDILEGPRYRRLTRGIYIDARAAVDHGTRIRAVRLAIGPDAVLTGRSAAWALGSRMAAPDDPVELTIGRRHRARPRPELLLRYETTPAESTIVTGLYGPATTRDRTAADLARRLPRTRAVAAVDALLNGTATRITDVRSVFDSMSGARGVRQARTVLDLCDPGAESPRESALRLLLVDAGLPRPVTQHVVRDAEGRFVARVDLAWLRERLAVEYDGAHHDTPEQIRRDRDRLNRLRLAGWTVLVIDRHQMRDPHRVVAQVRHALAR